MAEPTITLYGTPPSGHAHRVELLLLMLGLPYRYVEASAPVRRSPEFLALNPLGQIPVLVDGEVDSQSGEHGFGEKPVPTFSRNALVLPDSNAILVYLAKRYDESRSWLPEEPVAAARVQRWLSIAAGEVMYGPATARMALLWNMPGDPVRAAEIAGRLLRFMEGHIAQGDQAGRPYLATAHPTIADLACYPYLSRAPEGRIPLDDYPAVRAWLSRVESLPRFKPMPVAELKATG